MNESKSNGTATADPTAEMKDMIDATEKLIKEKGKAKSRKDKTSQFGRLWGKARQKGAKGKVNGEVDTDGGRLTVVVSGFPAALTDESYTDEAANSGMSVAFPLAGYELSGVRLKNGNMKFEGEGAVEMLTEILEVSEGR